MSHTTLFAWYVTRYTQSGQSKARAAARAKETHTQFWCVLCATKIPDCIEFYIEITTRHRSVCFDDSVHDVPSRLHCYLRTRKLSAHFHSLLCGRFWFQFTGFCFSLTLSLFLSFFHVVSSGWFFFVVASILSIVRLPKLHTNPCSLTFSRLLGRCNPSAESMHAITIRCRFHCHTTLEYLLAASVACAFCTKC